ncbi:hypothetical protein PITC_067930 [Penicillium italicum]|uniref:Uncharacterized protein n=1 Tax=Penicillium italicum TaxID=40296 RepID=A0A0A2LH38_PENIT|nr:hypothetical protein PITC_067930 [Penicillium italicum]
MRLFCGRPRKPRPLRQIIYSSTCEMWVYVHLVPFSFRPHMMKRHKKTSICPSQLAGEDDKLSCLINSRISTLLQCSFSTRR